MSDHRPITDWIQNLVESCLRRLSPIHLTLIAIALIFFSSQQPQASTCDVPNNLINNSRAEYERLEPGMSLVKAESILGRGIEIQRSQDSATFEWKNSDCSSITIVFDSGKLVNKEQLNLP